MLYLPKSLWAATAQPAPVTEPLRTSEQADVVVVGAGFTGLRAALELAEAGVTVHVIEKAEVGYGASGRTGGQVIPGFRPDPDELERLTGREQAESMFTVASRSADELFDLVSRYKIECDAVQTGWIQVAHHKSAYPLIRNRFEQWRRRGAPVELLERSDIERLTGARTYNLGWTHQKGGNIQPLSYARGLARAAMEAGARIFTQSPATKIVRNKEKWSVHTPEGIATAKEILLCTNGYTDQLWQPLARTVVPVFSMQVATEPLSDDLKKSVIAKKQTIADTRRSILYFRTDRSHRLVFGGIGMQRESENKSDYSHLCELAFQIFPQLSQSKWDFFWGGYFCVTRDRLPHICELAPGVTSCVGFNGRGVALTTVLGRILAERILQRPTCAWPTSKIDPYLFHRFYPLGVATRIAWSNFMDRIQSSRKAVFYES